MRFATAIVQFAIALKTGWFEKTKLCDIINQDAKFGSVFKETINHFEDDNGYDLFVPIAECRDGEAGEHVSLQN